MPSSGGQRSRELFSPAANRAEQAQTLATQETKWKESQRRHSTQAANVRMEPGKPDSGPIGLNAIALVGPASPAHFHLTIRRLPIECPHQPADANLIASFFPPEFFLDESCYAGSPASCFDVGAGHRGGDDGADRPVAHAARHLPGFGRAGPVRCAAI